MESTATGVVTHEIPQGNELSHRLVYPFFAKGLLPRICPDLLGRSIATRISLSRVTIHCYFFPPIWAIMSPAIRHEGSRAMLHAWHDVSPGDDLRGFSAVIEIALAPT